MKGNWSKAALTAADIPDLEHLKAKVSYYPVSGLLVRRGRAYGNWTPGSLIGEDYKKPYDRMKIKGREYCTHKIIWFLHYEEWPLCAVDHINRCKWDNRIDNLRLATRSQNEINKTALGGNSEFKGVTQCHRGYGWVARLQVEKRRIWLGTFDSETEAAEAYDEAAVKHFGEFAVLNSPARPSNRGA